ncbi:hypothetical protein [Blastococcus sp. CT_GayMR16]|uniref:hypothetical protein n=1 Tax=Blastococcus sp. CT_GayMR16 TaxID=2559607 RepID=UPI00142FA9EC|nr:hypothetical protein [Blastococcus sp. CT_GayMR16]
MSETPDERPRPTPRPRPGAVSRPTPRPRVAGSRREREEAAEAAARPARPTATARPVTRTQTKTAPAARPVVFTKGATGGSKGAAASATARRRAPVLVLVLALLCLLAAAGGGLLLWQRLNPSYVDSTIFSAARSGVQALYAYDYRDSDGSVQRKLDVLTGDLRDQYEEDLGQGGIIDTYEQVSATTSYEVLDVGLQQVNEAQDTATVVVFGEYVVKSVNTGDQAAPEGSECTVTADGGQSCTQTVQVRITRVDGDWKISELTLLTSS